MVLSPHFMEENCKIPVEYTVTVSEEHFLQERSLKFKVRTKIFVKMLPVEGRFRNML